MIKYEAGSTTAQAKDYASNIIIRHFTDLDEFRV